MSIGDRIVGHRPKLVRLKSGREITVLKPIKERVFAGQEKLFGVGAQNMNISAECGILGLDAIVDNLDEGTGAAVIQGRSGAQPVDPDAATGTGGPDYAISTRSSTALRISPDRSRSSSCTGRPGPARTDSPSRIAQAFWRIAVETGSRPSP